MQKNIIQISTITITLLILTIAFITTVNAQPPELPTFVKGYVYIDDIKTQPEEVSLQLPDEMVIATLYDDGRYILNLSSQPMGTTGTFLVIYNGESYTPPETVTNRKQCLCL